MDPILFLSQQTFQRNAPNTPLPHEIDEFYAAHGMSPFHTLSRWRAALAAAWQRLLFQRRETVNVAAIAHRS